MLSDNAIRRLANIPWMLDEFLPVIHPDYNRINWRRFEEELKKVGMELTGDKALDYLRYQGLYNDKWNDKRWEGIGTKPVARRPGWIKQWIKEFYLKHGRYPTEEEIDDFYRQLPPDMQHDFFGHADEDEIRNKYLYRFQNKGISTNEWKSRVMNTVGFFTVNVSKQE